jgi:hypothetical protein
MPHDQLITAIGRIERVLTRLEKLEAGTAQTADTALRFKHETLKTATRDAIRDIDTLIKEAAN